MEHEIIAFPIHILLYYLCLGRQVPDRKNEFRTRVLCFETGAVRFSLHKCLKLQCLGHKLQDKASSSFFHRGPLPPSVYLHRHSHDKMDQAFLLRFCILQSKTGQWEGLGTRLLFCMLMVLKSINNATNYFGSLISRLSHLQFLIACSIDQS